MDLENLKSFAAVAEHGSFTKASISLSSLPSALSRSISALERECGGRLFHRTGRGVTLTELGERILPRIKELLSDLDSLSHEIRTNAGVPAGQVRIGLLASLAHPLISRLYQEVRVKYPEVRLNVFGAANGKLDEWLANGFIDIALLFRYGKSAAENEQALGVVDTFLIGPAGDEVTSEPTVNFSCLHNLPLILPGPPNGLRVILDQMAKQQGVTLSILMEANSLPVQTDIVAEGGVYTVLAGYAAARGIGEGRLQASRIVNPGIERTVTLAFSPRPATLASREVVRMITRIVDDMAHAMDLRSLRINSLPGH